MAKPRRACKTEGCDEPHAQGLDFCVKHLSEPRRCRAFKRSTGEQCQNAARRGTDLCATHSGKKTAEKSAKAKALTDMQRFAKPYEGDIDPIRAFEDEFRRTWGRIQWYDDMLSRLVTADDLIWGLTKVERIAAAEHPGTNKTYEARLHAFEEAQRWERKHFLDMEKVWISAGIETKKLNIMKSYVELAYTRLVKALTALGHDLGDPKVRDALDQAFSEPATGSPLALEGPEEVETP